jgi:hypothetical protein
VQEIIGTTILNTDLKCSINQKKLDELQGFDELLALGIAYDDEEFVRRVKINLSIKFVDHVLVLHQNHYNPNSSSLENRKWGSFLYGINYILINQNPHRRLINRLTKKLTINQKKIILIPYIAFRLLKDKAFYELIKQKMKRKKITT